MAGLRPKKAILLVVEDDVGVLLTHVHAGDVVVFELSTTRGAATHF